MGDSDDFKTYFEPLQKSIEAMNEALVDLKTMFEERLKSQKAIINNLLTRVSRLETQINFNAHIGQMHERKLDDFEQISRKINLKISGLAVVPNDSPKSIMEKIKGEATELDLGIPDSEYDRCHRVGKKYWKNGVCYQDVLLKLCFWRTRDVIYTNRKSFTFSVSHDLTTRRRDLLHFANDNVEIDDNKYVDFIFADKNCILKIKSKDNNFYGFNSEAEFFSIIYRLRFEHYASNEHLSDAAKGKEINVVNDYYY